MTSFTTEDRINAEIDNMMTDAQDAFYAFDDENGNIFDDDDRMIFVEAFNQGQEAMRAKVLTLLDKMKGE